MPETPRLHIDAVGVFSQVQLVISFIQIRCGFQRQLCCPVRTLVLNLGASLSTKGRQRHGSGPFSFAVSIRLKMTALLWVLSGVFVNRNFFLDITKGLMLRSA